MWGLPLLASQALSVWFPASTGAPTSHGDYSFFFTQAVKISHRMFLQPVKFIKAEASCQFVHHSFQRDKGCNDLEGEEEGKDDMDCSLQWLNFQTFIE